MRTRRWTTAGRPLSLFALGAAALAGLARTARAAQDGATPRPAAEQPSVASAESPTETGQATFAAVSEIVSILANDPETDWARVDIGALRDHLVDMDLVMVGTRVSQKPVQAGLEMTIEGSPQAMAAAGRMVQAHTDMVAGVRGWHVTLERVGDALIVCWTTPRPAEVERLRALGFYGFLVEGHHHQQHHLMIARGMNPHDSGMR